MKRLLFVVCLFVYGWGGYSQTGTITDTIDGKVYKTVVIGNQTWTTENLNVSTFRNGDPIPEAKTRDEWEMAADNNQPAWCYFNNEPKNGEKFEKLYNWYAINDPRGIAPSGWHIPSIEEWDILVDYLGFNCKTMMKTEEIIKIITSYEDYGGYDERTWVPCSNCSYWTEQQSLNNPCTICRNEKGKYIKTGKYIPKTKKKVEEKINLGWNGTNESGFSAIPVGLRYDYGEFQKLHCKCESYFWSTTVDTDDRYIECIQLSDDSRGNVLSSRIGKGDGASIRCIKD